MENKTLVQEARTAAKEVVNTKRDFVEFSYSSEDAFRRREAIKDAAEHVRRVVKETGGSMPKELIDAYEGLNEVFEHIKRVELEVIRVGR